MKSLLLIAYYYPPLAGPAVQRPTKTVRYLAQYGWEVDVITVNGIIYHSSDDAKPIDTYHKRIFRTPSFDPLYLMHKLKQVFKIRTDKLYQTSSASQKSLVKRLFPVDDKIGWVPFVIQAGLKALRTKPYSAVMVTCNPFSASLAGLYLARRAHIPFVMDYRDHWTLNNAAEQPTGLLYKFCQYLEKRVLSGADLITTATEVMKKDLVNTFGSGLDDKITPFFNGWDEADFEGLIQSSNSGEKITITYLGALYRDRKITGFLQAVRMLLPKYPQLEIRLIGNFYSETKAEIESSGIRDKITLTGQLPHHAALEAMYNSDILLLIIGDEKLKWVLTGKLFEYLRSLKPIIALAPDNGEAAKILRSCGHDSICAINNPQRIQDSLAILIERFKINNFSFSIPYQYERSEQVRKLAAKLDDLKKLKRNVF